MTVAATRRSLLGTKDVAVYAGVSERRVDYWTRTGVLLPDVPARGSGSQRQYSPLEARVAWMIGQAAGDSGADLAGMRRAVDAVRAAPVWGGLLVTNGVESVVALHAADLLDALERFGPSVRVVDLDAAPDPAGVLQ